MNTCPNIYQVSRRVFATFLIPLLLFSFDSAIAQYEEIDGEIYNLSPFEIGSEGDKARLSATTQSGETNTRRVVVDCQTIENNWPLPSFIDWTRAKSISDVAQVVDGKWEITKDGVCAVERFYDRVIALLIAHHSDVTFGNVQIFPFQNINQQAQ